jgi:hypothetical protein
MSTLHQLFFHPFLLPWEAFLGWLLSRSPRVGALVVKEHSSSVVWTLRDRSDIPWDVGAPITEPEPMYKPEPEPASMLFERMYHAPDADKG